MDASYFPVSKYDKTGRMWGPFKAQNFIIDNINEVITQTQKYVFFFQAALRGTQGPQNAVWC